jgi:hypothetical protein
MQICKQRERGGFGEHFGVSMQVTVFFIPLNTSCQVILHFFRPTRNPLVTFASKTHIATFSSLHFLPKLVSCRLVLSDYRCLGTVSPEPIFLGIKTFL